jgi:hypothetical protein
MTLSPARHSEAPTPMWIDLSHKVRRGTAVIPEE